MCIITNRKSPFISNGLITNFRHFINILQVHFKNEHVLLDLQLQFQLIYNTYEKHEMYIHQYYQGCFS